MIAAHRNTLFEPDYTEIASLFFPFRLLEDLNCQQNFILMIAGCRDRVFFLWEYVTAVWLRYISWYFQEQQTNFSGFLTAVYEEQTRVVSDRVCADRDLDNSIAEKFMQKNALAYCERRWTKGILQQQTNWRRMDCVLWQPLRKYTAMTNDMDSS